ncbi:zinc finger protein 23 isoform X2 [Nilaparvata lugens]|uniref:zinc finger protein 23 isoform X2 n=1 Tax=Nilaparvata lugens TaxID=108931 RepID=UPI00193E8BE5|nr:zinc finger protein 23 isoform X2 [Nilaparvata lugens]
MKNVFSFPYSIWSIFFKTKHPAGEEVMDGESGEKTEWRGNSVEKIKPEEVTLQKKEFRENCNVEQPIKQENVENEEKREYVSAVEEEETRAESVRVKEEIKDEELIIKDEEVDYEEETEGEGDDNSARAIEENAIIGEEGKSHDPIADGNLETCHEDGIRVKIEHDAEFHEELIIKNEEFDDKWDYIENGEEDGEVGEEEEYDDDDDDDVVDPVLEEQIDVCRGVRTYKCSVCNKALFSEEDLNLHERIHSDKKPHKCLVCTKTLSCKWSLKRHERIHSGEKPFECSICNKRFIIKTNLNAHERIHSGEKPFECSICNKRFITKANLNAHERIHSGENPLNVQFVIKRTLQRLT